MKVGNARKLKKEIKGITLIALVVTIIVLLILATVALNLTVGSNGIFTRAKDATLINENAEVFEQLQFKVADYEFDKVTNKSENEILTLLKQDGYLDENNVLNVTELMKRDTQTGKGSLDSGDVYVIELDDDTSTEGNYKYNLVYYNKDGERKVLGKAFEAKEEEEFLEPTPEEYFEFDETTGGIALKNSKSFYELGVMSRIIGKKTLVIPSTYMGKEVTKLGIEYTAWEGQEVEQKVNLGINAMDVERVVIPNTIKEIKGDFIFERSYNLKEIFIPNSVTKIGSFAFASSWEGDIPIKTITIPESVQEMGYYVFGNTSSLEAIFVPFEEGNLPSGWNPGWNGSDATVVYKGQTYEPGEDTEEKPDTERTNFAKEYIKDKNKEELEELFLKTAHFIGTIEEYEELQGFGKNIFSEDTIRNMLIEPYSWVYQIEYGVNKYDLNNKTLEELREMFVVAMGGQGTFDEWIQQGGMSMELYMQYIKAAGCRSEEDFLKYMIVTNKEQQENQ